MDAYDIHQLIFQAWQRLANNNDATTVKKAWSQVPVYVKIDGQVSAVSSVTVEDGKIILETK